MSLQTFASAQQRTQRTRRDVYAQMTAKELRLVIKQEAGRALVRNLRRAVLLAGEVDPTERAPENLDHLPMERMRRAQRTVPENSLYSIGRRTALGEILRRAVGKLPVSTLVDIAEALEANTLRDALESLPLHRALEIARAFGLIQGVTKRRHNAKLCSPALAMHISWDTSFTFTGKNGEVWSFSNDPTMRFG
jgi:hypothetical protein